MEIQLFVIRMNPFPMIKSNFNRMLQWLRVGWLQNIYWVIIVFIGIIWIFAFLLYPLGSLIIKRSIPNLSSYLGEILGPMSKSSYYSALASTICVVLAIPISISIIMGSKLVRRFFILLTFLPLFSSLILRVYSLRYISLNKGILFQIASLFGREMPLFGSFELTIIGFVYLYLPFAVIPLTISLNNIDKNAIEAGFSIGMKGKKLRKAVLMIPIRRGIFAAFFLTFIPAFTKAFFKLLNFLRVGSNLFLFFK